MICVEGAAIITYLLMSQLYGIMELTTWPEMFAIASYIWIDRQMDI